MQLADPVTTTAPPFLNGASRLVQDPRDVSMLWLMLQCAVCAGLGVSLYFLPVSYWISVPVYWVVLFGGLVDRFTLMLHCTSHRVLFKPEYRFLNQIIPWFLAPFFGQTPNTYFAHHMGMHHREENLPDDLSSTMRFKRDRLDHWLRYYFRFLFIGLFELSIYFYRRKQWKLFGRVLVGESSYWGLLVALAYVNPIATFAVFLFPLLAIRTLMMMGNWTQHSFVCRKEPENPYRASITCINTRYNRRCFNDGYHILHHVKPRCHWTEHPIEFQRALPEYAKHDAIVFDGIDYFEIWLCLMFGRWSRLESKFVRLEGAPARSKDEVIAFLRERVEPIRA
jgi:fatty acid desaturase